MDLELETFVLPMILLPWQKNEEDLYRYQWTGLQD